jgi:hypothetical protein
VARLKECFRIFAKKLQASRWVNLQTVMIILVVILFVVAIFSGEAIARMVAPAEFGKIAAATATPRPDVEVQIDPELLQTANQTNAITIGAAILVLIIVFGVIIHLRQRRVKP